MDYRYGDGQYSLLFAQISTVFALFHAQFTFLRFPVVTGFIDSNVEVIFCINLSKRELYCALFERVSRNLFIDKDPLINKC